MGERSGGRLVCISPPSPPRYLAISRPLRTPRSSTVYTRTSSRQATPAPRKLMRLYKRLLNMMRLGSPTPRLSPHPLLPALSYPPPPDPLSLPHPLPPVHEASITPADALRPWDSCRHISFVGTAGLTLGLLLFFGVRAARCFVIRESGERGVV